MCVDLVTRASRQAVSNHDQDHVYDGILCPGAALELEAPSVLPDRTLVTARVARCSTF
jgi:hypothetical protein